MDKNFSRDGSPLAWTAFAIATCIVLALRIWGVL